MEIIAAKSMENEAYQAFFEKETLEFNIEEAKKYGYFIKRSKEAIAFFTLIPVDGVTYWLSKLVMKENTPILLPVTIIEASEKLTKNFGATTLFIHSQTNVLDDLLTQLGYERTNQAIDPSIKAEWWKTHIDNVDKQLTYTQE